MDDSINMIVADYKPPPDSGGCSCQENKLVKHKKFCCFMILFVALALLLNR